MTFKTLFADLQIYTLFLAAGFLLREYVPLFRKLFLPASVLGGLVALLGSQQVMGWWTIPASFKQFSGELIVLIVCSTLLGVKVDKQRLYSYMDFFCQANFDRFGQIGFGILLGMALRLIWKDLPAGWGIMAFTAFLGGHGNSATYGGIMKELGYGTDYTDLGMILSTIGLVIAVVFGTVIVNRGVRKGWATYMPADAALKSTDERGLIPKPERKPLGMTLVYNSAVNNLAFQFALLMISIFLGKTLCVNLAKVAPLFKALPNTFYGVFGAIIMNIILHVLKADGYVERKTCNNLANFAMELLVLTSIASLNIKVLTSYWVPILIMSGAMAVFVYFVCFWYNKRIAEREWFEKAVYHFGNATGATPTAMLLLRMVDTESQSMVLEAAGACNGASKILTSWIPAVLPVMVMSNPWLSVWMNLAIMMGFFALGWLLFRKKVRALGR